MRTAPAANTATKVVTITERTPIEETRDTTATAGTQTIGTRTNIDQIRTDGPEDINNIMITAQDKITILDTIEGVQHLRIAVTAQIGVHEVIQETTEISRTERHLTTGERTPDREIPAMVLLIDQEQASLTLACAPQAFTSDQTSTFKLRPLTALNADKLRTETAK